MGRMVATSPALNVPEICAGAGGQSVGMEKAGYRTLPRGGSRY